MIYLNIEEFYIDGSSFAIVINVLYLFFFFFLVFFKEGRFVSPFRMKSSFIEPKPSGWIDLPVLSNWIWTHCNSQHCLKWPRKFFGGWNMEKIIIWPSYFEWMYPFSSLWLNYLFSFSFSFFFFFLKCVLGAVKGKEFQCFSAPLNLHNVVKEAVMCFCFDFIKSKKGCHRDISPTG